MDKAELDQIKEFLKYDVWQGETIEDIRQMVMTDVYKLFEVIEEQREIIKTIAVPDIQQWFEYKKIHGEGISFQEFLKDIAKNYARNNG